LATCDTHPHVEADIPIQRWPHLFWKDWGTIAPAASAKREARESFLASKYVPSHPPIHLEPLTKKAGDWGSHNAQTIALRTAGGKGERIINHLLSALNRHATHHQTRGVPNRHHSTPSRLNLFTRTNWATLARAYNLTSFCGLPHLSWWPIRVNFPTLNFGVVAVKQQDHMMSLEIVRILIRGVMSVSFDD
jgi:hypothetical protein